MVESTVKPEVQQLQGAYMVPYNVRQETREDEDAQRVVWVYDVIRVGSLRGLRRNDLDQWKKETIKQLNNELHEHIYKVYDPGTQMTINGYAVRALHEGRSAVVEECRKIQDWVDQVLDYYDAKKLALAAASTDDERMSVTWDFARDVPLNEFIDWRNIKSMFGAAK